LFTLKIFEICERVDGVCKLFWLSCLSMVGGGDDAMIWSSWSDVVELFEGFCLYIELIRLTVTNCGWSLVVCSSRSGITDLASWRGRNNVEK